MKLSYLLALVCTAFVVVQADITLEDVVVQADIGSGGTRLSVFIFEKPGVPTVCKFADDKKANCVSEVQVASGRVTTDSTKAEWDGDSGTGVAHELLKTCFNRLEATVTTACKPLTKFKGRATYETFFKAVPIIVTATAGARRTVISKTLDNIGATPADAKITDFVKDVVVTSLKKAAGDNPRVQGGVIDGAMEGYFGYMSAAMLLGKEVKKISADTKALHNWQPFTSSKVVAVQPSAQDFRKNFAFLEIGGASQQFAWWDDSISTRTNAQLQRSFTEHRASQTSSFLEVQGDMVHQFPKVEGFTTNTRSRKLMNHVYAASLLGTGGDRMDIALIKHFMNTKSEEPKMAENFQADPIKTGITGNIKIVTNPCFIMRMSPIVHGCWKKEGEQWQSARVSLSCEAGEHAAPVFLSGKPATPWKDLNVLGDIKTDPALMAFLQRGSDYQITGPKDSITSGKDHFEACSSALKSIYAKDHSESLADVGQGVSPGGQKTNPYRYMMTFFKKTLAKRSIREGWDETSKYGMKLPTEFMVASRAVLLNMGDVTKPVNGEPGCFDASIPKYGDAVQFCKLKYSNIPEHAANQGCGKTAGGKGFSPFDISACRAVAEPYELIEQLMPTKAKITSMTFINNDFAQAAAMFVNQGALKEGNQMRLYTTDDTFAAEDKLWQGEACGKPPCDDGKRVAGNPTKKTKKRLV